MYTSKKHTSNTCAWQRANPDQSGSSINYNIIIILLIVNIYPTRLGNILDLILTNCPEKVSNVSCVPAIRINLFSDHNLLFYDIDLHTKSSSCVLRF